MQSVPPYSAKGQRNRSMVCSKGTLPLRPLVIGRGPKPALDSEGVNSSASETKWRSDHRYRTGTPQAPWKDAFSTRL